MLLPVPSSRATFKTPLSLASAARIAAYFCGLIIARPIGLPQVKMVRLWRVSTQPSPGDVCPWRDPQSPTLETKVRAAIEPCALPCGSAGRHAKVAVFGRADGTRLDTRSSWGCEGVFQPKLREGFWGAARDDARCIFLGCDRVSHIDRGDRHRGRTAVLRNILRRIT